MSGADSKTITWTPRFANSMETESPANPAPTTMALVSELDPVILVVNNMKYQPVKAAPVVPLVQILGLMLFVYKGENQNTGASPRSVLYITKY